MTEKAEGTEILTIRLSKYINSQLEKLVQTKKFPSKSDIIRTAIVEYLANHREEFLLWIL